MNPIDLYISNIENSHEQKALENLRSIIHEFLPTAEECISYGMPAFRVGRHCVAGFARYKDHLSFFPFSGTTLEDFRTELDSLGYTYTKSGIHFTPDTPLPRDILERIIQKRLSES